MDNDPEPNAITKELTSTKKTASSTPWNLHGIIETFSCSVSPYSSGQINIKIRDIREDLRQIRELIGTTLDVV